MSSRQLIAGPLLMAEVITQRHIRSNFGVQYLAQEYFDMHLSSIPWETGFESATFRSLVTLPRATAYSRSSLYHGFLSFCVVLQDPWFQLLAWFPLMALSGMAVSYRSCIVLKKANFCHHFPFELNWKLVCRFKCLPVHPLANASTNGIRCNHNNVFKKNCWFYCAPFYKLCICITFVFLRKDVIHMTLKSCW